MKRNQWSAVALAVLLFGAGVATGALGHRYYTASTVAANSPGFDARRHYVSDMTSRLKLTSQQVDQLEDILDRTKSKFRVAHETCRPAMSQVKEQQISEVKAILTPSQVPLYDQLLADRERRSKEQEAREHRAEEQEAAARKSRPH